MWISRIKSLLKTQTAKDSLASFMGHNTAALGGAVFFAVAFRLLGKESFGVVSLSLATATILKDISGPAINATLLRLVPQTSDPQKAQGYIRYAAKLLTHYYLVLAALALVFYHFLSLLIFKTSSLPLILITLLTSVGYSFGYLITGILHSQKKFYQEAFFTFSMSVARLLLLAAVFLLGSVTTFSVLAINFLAYLVISLIGLSYVRLRWLSAPITPAISRSTQRFLLPMVFFTGTTTLTDKINLYVTHYFAGLADVGLLGAVTRLFIPVQQFGGVVSSVFGSRYSGFATLKDARLYLAKTTLGAGVLSLGLVSTVILARPIGLVIYGADFAAAIPVFRMLILAFAFFILQIPFSGYLLYFKGRSDLMARISLFQLIFSLALNLLLIPRFGLLGAAWALSLSLVTNCLITVAVSQLATTKK